MHIRGAMEAGLVGPVKPSHPYLENDPPPLFDLRHLRISPRHALDPCGKEFPKITPDPTPKIFVTTNDGRTTKHEHSFPSGSDERDRLGGRITKAVYGDSSVLGLNNPTVEYNPSRIVSVRAVGPEPEQRQAMGFLQDRT